MPGTFPLSAFCQSVQVLQANGIVGQTTPKLALGRDFVENAVEPPAAPFQRALLV